MEIVVAAEAHFGAAGIGGLIKQRGGVGGGVLVDLELHAVAVLSNRTAADLAASLLVASAVVLTPIIGTFWNAMTAAKSTQAVPSKTMELRLVDDEGGQAAERRVEAPGAVERIGDPAVLPRPTGRCGRLDEIGVAVGWATPRRAEIAVEEAREQQRVEFDQRVVVGDVLLRLRGRQAAASRCVAWCRSWEVLK